MLPTLDEVLPPGEHPAILLDRDGVLIEDLGYVYKPSDLVILPGVPKSLTELKRLGYKLIVITNQSGVARGLFSEEDVKKFHRALDERLAQAGAPRIDAYYYCPHLPTPDAKVDSYRKICFCRKPGTGMIKQAATQHRLDLQASFLVGDKPDDVECGFRMGVASIQVARPQTAKHPAALALVPSLEAALSVISRPQVSAENTSGLKLPLK